MASLAGILSVTGVMVERALEAFHDVWSEGMLAAALTLVAAEESMISEKTLAMETRTTRPPIRILERRNLGL